MNSLTNNYQATDESDGISAFEFNKKLTSNPAFLCSICKRFLKPPIMLISETDGHVCGSCNTNEVTAVRNIALESIMSNLIWQCTYSNNGCVVSLSYINILKHEIICQFRNFSCPLKTIDNCPWNGTKLSLLNHVFTHCSYSVQNCDDRFKFDLIMKGNDEDIIKFLNFSNEDKFIFIAQVKHPDNLFCDVYYLGTRNKIIDTYCYKIFQTNSACTPKEFLHGCFNIEANMDDVEFPAVLPQMKLINLNICKFLAAEGKFTFTVQIARKNNNDDKLNKAIQPTLECPVCCLDMRPPIFQCETGHSICGICKHNVTGICPICQTSINNVRNLALEKIANNIYFSCRNSDNGCNDFFLLSKIEEHESKCSYTIHKCEFCSYKCLESNIITHLKNLHGDKLLFQRCHILLATFVQSNKVFYVQAYNRVFKVEASLANGNFDWEVNLLGARPENISYQFEIGGIINQDISQKFVYADKTRSKHYGKYYFNIQQCNNSTGSPN